MEAASDVPEQARKEADHGPIGSLAKSVNIPRHRGISPRFSSRYLLLPETDAFARILGCREKFNAVLVFQHSLHRLKNLSATRIHLFALVRLDNAYRLPSHARLQS